MKKLVETTADKLPAKINQEQLRAELIAACGVEIPFTCAWEGKELVSIKVAEVEGVSVDVIESVIKAHSVDVSDRDNEIESVESRLAKIEKRLEILERR